MKVDNRGLIEIVGHEGVVLSAYYDSVNVPTMGVGHTAAAGAPNPKDFFGQEVGIDTVFDMLRRDIVKYENRVNRALKGAKVSQTEFNALVSFDYNTGGIFTASLTKSVRAGNKAMAARQFMNWTKPAEIKDRRRKEMLLFRDGTYSCNGYVPVYKANSRGKINWGSRRLIDVRPFLNARGTDVPKADAGGRRTIAMGDRTKAVQEAISLLEQAGYASGLTRFDDNMKAAVETFQANHGLLVDGIIGPKTWAVLEEAAAKGPSDEPAEGEAPRSGIPPKPEPGLTGPGLTGLAGVLATILSALQGLSPWIAALVIVTIAGGLAYYVWDKKQAREVR